MRASVWRACARIGTSSGWKFQVSFGSSPRARARTLPSERLQLAIPSHTAECGASARRCLSASPEPGMRTASTAGGAHSVSSLKPFLRKWSEW